MGVIKLLISEVMRLDGLEGEVTVKLGARRTPYAILSHTQQ